MKKTSQTKCQTERVTQSDYVQSVQSGISYTNDHAKIDKTAQKQAIVAADVCPVSPDSVVYTRPVWPSVQHGVFSAMLRLVGVQVLQECILNTHSNTVFWNYIDSARS